MPQDRDGHFSTELFELYELGGHRGYTYKALMQLVLTQIGRKRLLLPFPYFAWEVLAALPNRPVSRDQVKLMTKDNVVSRAEGVGPRRAG